MNVRTLVWGLVAVIVCSGVARSQSLADVARKEQERRKAIKSPARVYTNDDLRRYPLTTVTDAPAPDQSNAAPGSGQAGAKADARGKDEAPSVNLGEDYWRKAITDARSALARSRTYLEALQGRATGLTQEFYTREDPEQRSAVWKQRMRAMDDIERLQKEIADQERAVAKVEDDARKANVPPGWIR